MSGGRTNLIFRQIFSLLSRRVRSQTSTSLTGTGHKKEQNLIMKRHYQHVYDPIHTSEITTRKRTGGTSTPATSSCRETSFSKDVNLGFSRSLHTISRSFQRCKEYSTSTAVQINEESGDGKYKELAEQVNTTMASPDMGRLFAVVHVRGTQRKVTTEDVIIVNGDFPPAVGEKIRLEKVLMVGGKDFSLMGTPLLSRDIVKVEATVIEKTLSNFRVQFDYHQGSRYRKFKAKRNPQTMLVINSIQLRNIDPDSA